MAVVVWDEAQGCTWMEMYFWNRLKEGQCLAQLLFTFVPPCFQRSEEAGGSAGVWEEGKALPSLTNSFKPWGFVNWYPQGITLTTQTPTSRLQIRVHLSVPVAEVSLPLWGWRSSPLWHTQLIPSPGSAGCWISASFVST